MKPPETLLNSSDSLSIAAMTLCGLADEREAYQDPNLSRSWENDEPVTADPTDTLQRVPLLRRKIKTSYGVREKKKSMAKRLSFCQILRKLRCHLNSNIFSITPQPEWSWDREHNDLAYKVDCASSWGACRCALVLHAHRKARSTQFGIP